jgi:hypothetical protein
MRSFVAELFAYGDADARPRSPASGRCIMMRAFGSV